MKKTLTTLVAMAGACAFYAASPAMAGSTSEPGESVGGAPGAAAPPGLYFVEEDNWGSRSTPAGKSTLGVNINALAWWTPWTIAGGHLQFLAVVPTAEVGIPNGTPVAGYINGAFNPILASTLAWNLGGGMNVSGTVLGYLPESSPVADPTGSIEGRLGLSYLKDGWNFSANLLYGMHTTDQSMAGHPNYFNADLTAAKKLGKWEVGAVGYYSTDTQDSNDTFSGIIGKQSQFALGALVGYDWGPLTTQVYVTHDVWQQNYGGEDLRVWARVVVPLGDPLAGSAAPNMYHK